MSEPQFKPGDKVLVDGEIRIVQEYIEDSCGEGCCSAYVLEGDDFARWPIELGPVTCGFCDKPCGNPWCVTKQKKEKAPSK